MLNASRPLRAPLAARIILAAAAAGALLSASACSSDSTPGSTDAGTSTGGKSSTGGSSSGGASSGGKSGSSNGGSTNTGGSSGDSGGQCTGKPATGTNDAKHCIADDGGVIKQATGACVKDVDAAAPPPPDGDAAVSDYGDTLYGLEGDDDDCKYHVSYTVPPICEKEGVTFTATVTKTVDGKPVTGAYPYLEATLNDLPSSSAVQQSYRETTPGVYTVGPIVFDKAGKWVARFHFFEDCSDEPEDSPHGHIAFYIDVP